jgi:hypothetical protein
MTAAGTALTQSTQGMEWAAARPLWSAPSEEFAAAAQGEVQVFQASSVSTSSIWGTVEYPTLLKNDDVSDIIYNVITDDGLQAFPPIE